MYISDSEKFAALFNKKCPGAYRRINADDVRKMTNCHLIGRYGFFLRDDLEMVRGLLQYEQILKKRTSETTIDAEEELPKCKRCGQPLLYRLIGKKGRPREYCLKCESLRNAERQRKHAARKSKQPKKPHVEENEENL